MTATDAPLEAIRAHDGAASPAGPEAHETRSETDGTDMGEEIVQRIANVPRDIGWLMVSVGVLGVILPGIIGTPFLVAGIAVLAPGGPQLLTRWAAESRPKGFVLAGLKQMSRWLDDLERRYPPPPSSYDRLSRAPPILERIGRQVVVEISGVVRYLARRPFRLLKRLSRGAELDLGDNQTLVVAMKHVDLPDLAAELLAISRLRQNWALAQVVEEI
jgi:hypothetical protein